jgi:hypothetical protein
MFAEISIHRSPIHDFAKSNTAASRLKDKLLQTKIVRSSPTVWQCVTQSVIRQLLDRQTAVICHLLFIISQLPHVAQAEHLPHSYTTAIQPNKKHLGKRQHRPSQVFP